MKGFRLAIDDDGGVRRGGIEQDALVLGDRFAVVGTELPLRPCRALDVGKEKRDGPFR